MSRNALTGLIVGIAAALGIIWGGVEGFLLVIVLGALGLFVGKVLDGDIDLSSLGGGGRGKDRQ